MTQFHQHVVLSSCASARLITDPPPEEGPEPRNIVKHLIRRRCGRDGSNKSDPLDPSIQGISVT